MRDGVHLAGLRNRDGGALVMATLFGFCPFPLELVAEGGEQGPAFQHGLRKVSRRVEAEIVERSD